MWKILEYSLKYGISKPTKYSSMARNPANLGVNPMEYFVPIVADFIIVWEPIMGL